MEALLGDWVIGLAVETLVSHIRVPGFNFQSQLLSPASSPHAL